MRRHTFTDDKQPAPITIENRGREDAINVEIETIDLGGYLATFPKIMHRIVRDGGADQVVPEVRDADPAVLEVASRNLGFWFD